MTTRARRHVADEKAVLRLVEGPHLGARVVGSRTFGLPCGDGRAMGAAVEPSVETQPRRELTVLLCRGCCCGTDRKHPDVDHAAQLRTLEEAASRTTGIQVRAVGCVDECSRSNVVVVRCHTASGRKTTYWLGEMLTERKTNLLATWIATGGPRTGPLPMGLALSQFLPGNDAVCAVEKIEADNANGAPLAAPTSSNDAASAPSSLLKEPS